MLFSTDAVTLYNYLSVYCSFSEADVTVLMGDVPCMLRSVADVQIVCETAGAADTDSMTTHVQVSRVAYGDSIEVNIITHRTQPDANRHNLTYTAHVVVVINELKGGCSKFEIETLIIEDIEYIDHSVYNRIQCGIYCN